MANSMPHPAPDAQPPTDILRRAAALMRKRAEAATPGPWQSQWPTTGESWVWADDSTDICQTHRADDPDTHHIASWHPAVALAVADWLDGVAERWERDGLTPERTHACTVAHAYLGEGA